MKKKNKCEGCHAYTGIVNLCIINVADKTDVCPCAECLIKSNCSEACEKYFETLDNFLTKIYKEVIKDENSIDKAINNFKRMVREDSFCLLKSVIKEMEQDNDREKS